ncbi:unnamed protein product, partial [Didymodactylos carnosus]
MDDDGIVAIKRKPFCITSFSPLYSATPTRIPSSEEEDKNSILYTIKRLEDVTSRLESVANKFGVSAGGNNSSLTRNSVGSHIDNLPIIQDYSAIIDGSLKQFLQLSTKLNGDLKELNDHLLKLFNLQRIFIQYVIQCKKPTNEQEFREAIKSMSNEIQAIQSHREKHRQSPLFNHLSAISESIPALGWITVSPAPYPFIKEMSDAGQFYTNRVLKDFRDKDETHVNWVKLWLKILQELQQYVKQYHTTGLAWQTHGQQEFDPQKATIQSSTGSNQHAPQTVGGAPPPPPPPPSSLLTTNNIIQDNNKSRDELLNSINSLGNDITSHLKKVSDDQKVHKNPQLKAGGEQQSTSKQQEKPSVPSKSTPSTVQTPANATNKNQ